MTVLLLLAAIVAKTQGAYDEVRETADGEIVVMRTFDWEIEGQRAERVTVHWLLQEDGSMRYDFDRQPPATTGHHRPPRMSIAVRARCGECAPREASA
ncbi:hypothetical protein [Stenotrophomonas indicatrix]|uniref:hypothetical protein n=1 Tax=Stenotrophomonas indicatrix TaxID=2045451 RepID=UPI00320857D1